MFILGLTTLLAVANGPGGSDVALRLTTSTFPPNVTAISPTSGPTGGGTTVTIAGSHFVGVTAVMFGNVRALAYTVHSATLLSATAPPEAAGDAIVRIITVDGSSSATPSCCNQYNYSNPAITAMSPTFGPTGGGTTVTITGSNFLSVTAVMFGNVPAGWYNVISPTTLLVNTPPETAGDAIVRIITVDGSSSAIPGCCNQYNYVIQAPVNITRPAILGPTVVGSMLWVTTGTWAGSPTPTFSYQWLVCGSTGLHCQAMKGATTMSFTPGRAYVGHTLEVTVVATNPVGRASATSALTTRVTL